MDSQPKPSIYLGADGAYHDDTPENREQYPPVTAEAADTGTVVEAGSEVPPVSSEPATAKTREK